MSMRYGIIDLSFALSLSAAGQPIWAIGETRLAPFVNSVAFSPDGTRMASGSNDGTIRVLDAATRR